MVEVSTSACRASAGMSSGPAALPRRSALMAFRTSDLVGGGTVDVKHAVETLFLGQGVVY